MKKCQFCGNNNSDEMRFCLECGKPLPDAPIVFNLQDSHPQSQAGLGTNPYGQSAPTQFSGQGFQPQGFQSGFQQQPFSMAPPSKPRSNKKIYIAVAGIFGLIFLVIVGVGGIIAYNILKNDDDKVVKKSPTPTDAPTVSPVTSPTASPVRSPTVSPTPKTTSTPIKTDAEPGATIDKIWVDFNVREGGKIGMRVHTAFTAYNLKGQEVYLALYFQKADGTPLKTSNTRYATTSGQTAGFMLLEPAYDEAYFKDVEIFVPYQEFNLARGKYNLQIDACLIYKGGGLISHLDYYDFEYEKF